MFTNEQIVNLVSPLRTAYELQVMIEELRAMLKDIETEYSQLLTHCREKCIEKQDGYQMMKYRTVICKRTYEMVKIVSSGEDNATNR